MPPIDILLHNAMVLGAALVVVLLVAFLTSRRLIGLLAPLMRRFDASGALFERWRVRLSRSIVLAALVISLVIVGGGVVLSWYAVDAGLILRSWAQETLLRDPQGVALIGLQLLGVAVGAPVIFYLLRGLLSALLEGLAALPGFGGRSVQIAALGARLIGALRGALVVAALLLSASLVSAPASVQTALSVLVHVVVAFVVARAFAAGAHLAVDVAFDLSADGPERQGLVRYFGRLQRLAGVTKRALDYFIYVGAATLASDQLTPHAILSEAGRVAIRVVAVLYFSRVIVEVTELAIAEAFAVRDPELDGTEQEQRRTLIPVATSIVRYAIYIFATAMALGELGLDTTPLLAGAGLMGIAIGLGAQTIVSDLVSGFFILFEGVFLVGHRIEIGELVGFVEEIGVRMTKIRDEAGVLHCIPNGEIRSVASHSQDYVNAVVDFGVPHGEELSEVFAALKEHLDAARPRYEDILDETEIVIEELRESSIWIRTITRVKPGRDEDMSEALRLEIVAALSAAGVKPPHGHRVVELRGARSDTPSELRSHARS